MEDYIVKTVKAYDDTETFENNTRSMIPAIEINKFLALLKPGSQILDAGCAYGRDTGYMRSKGYKVSGIDLSPALIARAKELYPDIKFEVADIRTTILGSESIDGIWCHATLLHLNDKDMDKALAEFNRVFKQGGILAVSLKKGAGSKNSVEKFSSNTERFFNFKTKESFSPSLAKAGFKEIESYYINEREQFDQNKRDLEWLYSFSRKSKNSTHA